MADEEMVPMRTLESERRGWLDAIAAHHVKIMELEQCLRDIRAKAEQAPIEQGEVLCDLMTSISESATKALQVRKVKEN